MADLTRQYMVYVESMKVHNLELAAEYLLMLYESWYLLMLYESFPGGWVFVNGLRVQTWAL